MMTKHKSKLPVTSGNGMKCLDFFSFTSFKKHETNYKKLPWLVYEFMFQNAEVLQHSFLR